MACNDLHCWKYSPICVMILNTMLPQLLSVDVFFVSEFHSPVNIVVLNSSAAPLPSRALAQLESWTGNLPRLLSIVGLCLGAINVNPLRLLREVLWALFFPFSRLFFLGSHWAQSENLAMEIRRSSHHHHLLLSRRACFFPDACLMG